MGCPAEARNERTFLRESAGFERHCGETKNVTLPTRPRGGRETKNTSPIATRRHGIWRKCPVRPPLPPPRSKREQENRHNNSSTKHTLCQNSSAFLARSISSCIGHDLSGSVMPQNCSTFSNCDEAGAEIHSKWTGANILDEPGKSPRHLCHDRLHPSGGAPEGRTRRTRFLSEVGRVAGVSADSPPTETTGETREGTDFLGRSSGPSHSFMWKAEMGCSEVAIRYLSSSPSLPATSIITVSNRRAAPSWP